MFNKGPQQSRGQMGLACPGRSVKKNPAARLFHILLQHFCCWRSRLGLPEGLKTTAGILGTHLVADLLQRYRLAMLNETGCTQIALEAQQLDRLHCPTSATGP